MAKVNKYQGDYFEDGFVPPDDLGEGGEPDGCVWFRADGPLSEAIRERVVPGQRASVAMRRFLQRHFWLMEKGRRKLAGRFTADELRLLVDLIGVEMTILPPEAQLHMGSRVRRAHEREKIGVRYGVDAAGLAARLDALSDFELFVMMDSIEAFCAWTGREGHGLEELF